MKHLALFTEYDDLMRQYTQFDEEVHQDLGHRYHWLEDLRARTGHSLGVVYHKVSRNFVLVHWLYEPEEVSRRLFIEIQSFRAPPFRQWPVDLHPREVMLARLKPAADQMRESRRARQELHAKRRAEKDEKLSIRYNVAAYLKKKGLAQEAYLLENGYKPFDPVVGEEQEGLFG